MNFNSWQFLIFLPVVIILYWIIPSRFRWILLLTASYYFYMFWNVWLVFLILGTTLVSYLSGLLIEKYQAKKKVFLIITIVICLGVLFAFKYLEFLTNSVIDFLNLFAMTLSSVTWNILLPVGISFYTFQTLSYVIDVYRGTYKAEHHFGYYALFVSYFPQLVAGPIEKADILMPQLKAEHHINREDMLTGTRLLISGFIRKCVIADFIGIYVNNVFASLSTSNSLSIFLAGALFCIEMYCDFAGYSEIAMGCARLMGVKLTQNFNQPYLSQSYGEFFHRWHYSLNRWFTEYLYIPLGGNRKGKGREILNKIIVFGLCGLWHGARWTYLLWGLYAAFWVCLESSLINPAIKKAANKGLDINKPDIVLLRRVIMFLIFVPAALLFRASSSEEAGIVFTRLFTQWGFSISYFNSAITTLGMESMDLLMVIFMMFIIYFLYDFAYKDTSQEFILQAESNQVSLPKEKTLSLQASNSMVYVYGVMLIALMWVFLLANSDVSEFAYFQF